MKTLSIVTYKDGDIFYKLFNSVVFTNSEELFIKGNLADGCKNNGDCVTSEKTIVNGFKNYLYSTWFTNGFHAIKVGFGLISVVNSIGRSLDAFTNAFNTFIGYDVSMTEKQRVDLLKSYKITGIVYAYADLRTANLKYPCLWNKMVTDNNSHNEKVMELMKQGLAYVMVKNKANEFIIAIGQDFGNNYSLMEWNPGTHIVAAYNDEPKATLEDLDSWRYNRGLSKNGEGNLFHHITNNCNVALADLFAAFGGVSSPILSMYMEDIGLGLPVGHAETLMNALDCYLENCEGNYHLEELIGDLKFI
jgi:hypothetical protein